MGQMLRSFYVGEWLFDPSRNRAARHGHAVHVEAKPMQVMAYLAERAGRVVSKEAIHRDVWPNVFVTDDALTKCISELRKTVHDNCRNPRVIQTVHKVGYTLLANVSFPEQSPDRRTIVAVLPFDNLTGNSDHDLFSYGLTEETTAQLSKVDPKGMGVIARTSAAAYKERKLPVERIGIELGADYFVEGSVRSQAGRFRITAQLIRTSDQTHVWSESFERSMAAVIDAQLNVAHLVASQIRHALNSGSAPSPALAATDPESHALYMKARYFWNRRTRESMELAIRYFDSAIRKSPGYALAHCGLADCHNMMAYWLMTPPRIGFSKARKHALAALRLDPMLAEAHAALAYNDLEGRWDPRRAELGYSRALELNPDSVTARQWYAEFLCITGRFQESEQQLRQAEILDPLSLPLKIVRAAIHFLIGDARKAVPELQGILELDPHFPEAYHLLGAVYHHLGHGDRAVEQWLQMYRLLGMEDATIAGLRSAYGVAGLNGFFREEIRLLTSAGEYVSPFLIAMKYSRMGEADAACDWLEKSYTERCPWLLEARFDPAWNPIRDEPRFQALLGRLRFLE